MSVPAKERARRRAYLDTRQLSEGCFICAWNDYAVGLDWHHRDRSKKNFTINQAWDKVGWKRLLAELDLCVVLCARCHRLVEAGVLTLAGLDHVPPR